LQHLHHCQLAPKEGQHQPQIPPFSVYNTSLIHYFHCSLVSTSHHLSFPVTVIYPPLPPHHNYLNKCTAASELFSCAWAQSAIMNSPSSSELSSDLDLTSVGSLSPPPFYPSPPPSQQPTSGKGTLGSQKRSRDEEDAPLAKKRRKVEVKPRSTQHLDLRSPLTTTAPEQKSQLELLLKALRKRRKIVVIAGAGISVSAGSTYSYLCSPPSSY